MLESQPTTSALPDLDDSWLDATDRPQIVVNGPESPVEQIKVVLGALVVANQRKPTLFVQQGRLVRVVRDEWGRPFIQKVTSAWLRGYLMRTLRWVVREEPKGPKDGEPFYRDVLPPPLIVRDIYGHGDWPFPPPGDMRHRPTPNQASNGGLSDANQF